MSKFNKFDSLLEAAFTHFANGGFREGSPIKIKKNFLSSVYFKQHYSGYPEFVEYLTNCINNGTFFFIKRVAGESSEQNIKDANTNEGTGNVYLILKSDPRTVSVATEMSEFSVPGNFEYVEVLNFGNNLPPVQGVPNKYEQPIGTKPEIVQINVNLGNQPTDNSLPTKNVSI